MQWLFSPMVKVALALCAGIIFAEYSTLGFIPESLLLPLLAVICCIAYFFHHRLVYLLPTVFFLLGFGLYQYHKSSVNSLSTCEAQCADCFVRLKVSSLPSHSSGRLHLRSKACLGDSLQIGTKVSLDTSIHTSIGDQLYCSGKLYPISQSSSDGTFDWRQFWLNKGITHYFVVHKVHKLERSSGWMAVINAIGLFRERIRSNIIDQADDRETLGFVQALLLGDKSGIEKDEMQKYRASGSMHFLVVSGMHLGILYGVFIVLLKYLKLKWQKWMMLFLAMLCVWFYAFMAGAAASVIRAALMLSIYSIGLGMQKKHSLVNALAVSALIYLAFQPQALFGIGFQLSYGAVLGIAVFYGMLEGYLAPFQGVKRFFMDMVAISVSVQLAIAPILLFYFGEMPLYSLVSSCFISIAGLPLVYGVMAYVYIGSFPFYGEMWLNKVLGTTISFFNRVIYAIADWPFGQIRIEASLGMIIGFYLMVIGCLLLRQKQKNVYWAGLCGLGMAMLCWPS